MDNHHFIEVYCISCLYTYFLYSLILSKCIALAVKCRVTIPANIGETYWPIAGSGLGEHRIALGLLPCPVVVPRVFCFLNFIVMKENTSS